MSSLSSQPPTLEVFLRSLGPEYENHRGILENNDFGVEEIADADTEILCSIGISLGHSTRLLKKAKEVMYPPAAVQGPTLWRASGFLAGDRKVGFRRGLYLTANNYLGFYEKVGGVKQEPFSYEQNEESDRLRITVLFESRSDALHFRSSVERDIYNNSPNGDLWLELSVEPAVGVELADTIRFYDYRPDENSPAETPRHLSGITELFDDSPLFQYQRLEHERFFGALYKADRAHLIDKEICSKNRQFAQYQENENNFLALSKEVHCWFDARFNDGEKIPFFKLNIQNVAPNSSAENGYRFRVGLIVEAYNPEAARLLFPRLKDGSKVVNDRIAETFVYILNPDEFRFCLEWSARKISLKWNEPAAAVD